MRSLPIWLLLFTIVDGAAFAADYSLPERVRVLPIAFVPNDQPKPTAEQRTLYLQQIQCAQRRYAELLKGDTFELAKDDVEVVDGERSLDYYRNARERGAPDLVAELLDHFQVNRFQCAYVFCIMFMNSKDSFPEGGGRTINGGVNTGGGMLHISSGELARNEHYQTTLQHELGHAFGLPHVDVYGYDMKSNASLMSYNPAHFTKGMQPSKTPGVLIPEDLRVLALNDRVFAKTTFDSSRDVPAGYTLSKKIIPLGPMELPRHPDFYPRITTTAGEDVGSKVLNVVREQTKPSSGPGITYDNTTMWHSKPLADGIAAFEIHFPMPIKLSGLAVHSQHSGIDHQATAMKLEVRDAANRAVVVDQPLKSINEVVTFEPLQSQQWLLTLKSGPSKIIVLRGLRFFSGDEELFPHMVPYSVPAEPVAPTAPASPPNSRPGKAEEFAFQAARKRPAPTAAQQESAKKAVKEQFKVDIGKAKKADQKSTLARLLIEKSDAERDEATIFAMLTEAANTAAQAGQLDLAMLAIKRLDDQFFVDILPLKVSVLSAVTPPKSAEEAVVLLGKYKELAQEAVSVEDYATALKALQSAADDLKKPTFKPLRDDALASAKRLTLLRDAFETARPLRDTLKTSPDDAAANLAWGKFVCFYKHDFEQGLAFLAKANDKRWAPLAQKERKSDKLSNDWLQLGDDWFEASEGEKDPIRPLARDRADLAWSTALEKASDLGKADLELKTDARFTKLFGPSLATSNGGAAGATIPGSDRMTPGDYFTIEFWVSTRAARGTLLSKCHNVGDASIIAHLDGGAPQLSIKRGGGEGGSGAGAPLNNGRWHHIAIVKQTDEIVMYVDGRKGARITDQGGLGSTSPWKFGCSRDRPACAARFGGVRISSSARYDADFTPKKSFLKDSNTLFQP